MNGEQGEARWSALDLEMEHVGGRGRGREFVLEDEVVEQEADQISETDQFSGESIHIKDSCDVWVTSTDTQASINMQAALQMAIALVLSISIADGERAESVSQELLQRVQVKQENRQRLIIFNSREVRVATSDTDTSVNMQVLMQVLLALVAKIDVL
ncbi:spore coat protein [Tumebacillus lipolyticus]|uniref:Spore coat protein n=1 Tax=Tumebacillus lipolyticus TaxID=1280370 RepID=A0ABW4ZVF8_9BACL